MFLTAGQEYQPANRNVNSVHTPGYTRLIPHLLSKVVITRSSHLATFGNDRMDGR